MTDQANVEDATQAEFCTYCESMSDVFDHVLDKHGPHAALNTVSALLGYALFTTSRPHRVEGLGQEMLELSVGFARDMWAREAAPVADP